MMELFSAETSLRPDLGMTKYMNFDSVPRCNSHLFSDVFKIKTSDMDSSKVLSYRKTLTYILKYLPNDYHRIIEGSEPI